MIEDMAEAEDDGLLRALGRVEPPDPAVFEAARELLWSAVAAEMLAADPAGTESSRAAGPARPRNGHRHQAEPGC